MSPVAGSGTSSQTAPEVARSAQSTNASPTTPLAVKRRASSGSSTPTRRTPGAVKRGFPEGSQLLRTPANSHLFQPRLTKSREFSGRPTRGNSRSEGTRPVRSGLPPPPSSLPNLDREETRAGFPYSFRGFAGVGAPRDARDVRIAPHYRSRSRLSISGGSVCADGFLVGVPFTLQWPPMAVCDGHSPDCS